LHIVARNLHIPFFREVKGYSYGFSGYFYQQQESKQAVAKRDIASPIYAKNSNIRGNLIDFCSVFK